MPMKKKSKETITVSGITFSANDIVTATLKIEGRQILIEEKDKKPKQMGFNEDD